MKQQEDGTTSLILHIDPIASLVCSLNFPCKTVTGLTGYLSAFSSLNSILSKNDFSRKAEKAEYATLHVIFTVRQ